MGRNVVQEGCGGDGVKVSLPAIRHDQIGFEALVRLHAKTKECFLDDVEIDMTATDWFDADMCAALGAILYRLGDDPNNIRLTNIPKWVAKILSKNGFLSNYGGELAVAYGIRRWGNETLRQMFKQDIDAQIGAIGLRVPDPERGRKIL